MPAAPAQPQTAPGAWTRWLQRPRSTAFRKVVFQLHLWSGLALGLYIFFISVTGSVLVYRNELYVWATPASNGGSVSWGFNAVTTLIELHRNLLAGSTGLVINGIAAAAVIFVLLTGLVLWWPGITQWKQGLVLRRGVPWRRLVWDLHRVVGFWTFAAMFVFALSGIYLCFGSAFHAFADWLQPPAANDDGSRIVDTLLYWLAFLHFGRINGIGLFCEGPGVCDQAVKATWALFGLAPALMFVTGTIVWWNRVLRPLWRRHRR
ncbi:MAG: PepSY-associated TM helix domain-containing protein [Gammaproteobacteria bacterium]